MKTREKKRNVLFWRGLLNDCRRSERSALWVALTIASVSLTFTQIGFVGIDLVEGQSFYIATVLLPMTLGALMLGVLPGTVLGFIAGVVLYIHALVMPLDYYELAYVTPITAIVMLTVVGFLSGLLFAIALRNGSSLRRSIISIVVVCIVSSALFSVGFFMNVLAALAYSMLSTVGPIPETLNAAQQQVLARAALRMGHIGLQIVCDAALMVALCIAGLVIARKRVALMGQIGLRSLFALWLLVVFLLAFMVIAAVSFALISNNKWVEATEKMNSEVTYLCSQTESSASQGRLVEKILESEVADNGVLSDEDLRKLSALASPNSLLSGYTVEDDGIIVVSAGDTQADSTIVTSDDPRLRPGKHLRDAFENDVIDAIEQSVESGQMMRIVYLVGSDVGRQEEDYYEIDAEHMRLAMLYAKKQGDYTVTMVLPSEKVFADRDVVMMSTTLTSLVLLIVVFIMTALLLSRMVVRHIDETNIVLDRITDGDLDARVEAHDTREFTSLSSGINKMVGTLEDWISEAETRMDAELATAKAIQQSTLPRAFPPFPDVPYFDIYASMKAAREVGGDFYDFFLIGDGSESGESKLGFVVADVSGKGVPAALFMMNAKVLIRGYMESGIELGEAIENANRQLCDGNSEDMFVTLFAGVLDYESGHVELVNAGHNPPLLWKDGKWQWLKQKSGLPLGLFGGMPYKAYSIDCSIGDQFLIYTDGVTEAMDVNENLYGEKRLEELAQMNYDAHPRELVNAVKRDIAKHAEGAEQSDDITLLSLEVGVPPEVTATLTVPAIVEELSRVNDFIHTELDKRLCPVRTQKQLDIAVEELFVNVASYAYPDATPENPGVVRVSYAYSASPSSVTIEIADDGVPFNPLAKSDAVIPESIDDLAIGGLGILMTKRSVDEMRYERVDESNVVTIVKKW